ncbi:MAG TPA: hypothetical protein VL574_07610 [Stellaceae bacterium]|jgi:hypothetical protein|nr:hypothetical protein [Stellaceae bacterium]
MNSAVILRFARPALALGFVAVSTAACVVEPEPPARRAVVVEHPRPVVVERPAPPVVVERPAPSGFCYYHPHAPACQ